MTTMTIPVTKGKTTVEIDLDSLPDETLKEIYFRGLKDLVNSGMTKVTAKDIPDQEERKAKAVAIANENVEKIMTGKVKATKTAKAKGVGREVMTEAMRLARGVVKDEAKRLGYKISHIEAKVITAAAKKVLEGHRGPALLAQAEGIVKARTDASMVDTSEDIGLVVSEKKVAAEAKKAAASKKAGADVLSAAQAGKVAPHTIPQKGQAPKHVNH